jgi:hypothetical protein
MMAYSILKELRVGTTSRPRTARTGNAEMFDDLVGYEGIKRTFLGSLGAKLLFGNSAKIIVQRS